MLETIKKINELKRTKKAVILVHNYQRPEIYQIADFIGDSLELARQASMVEAEIIVFCGVDFMAESAKILNPEKKVLLPALQARCPMAAMVTPADLKKKQAQYPEAKTVCYVNTSAEIKALSDVCCTSANAVSVVENIKARQLIFVPDTHLAEYVQSQVPDKEIIPWPGFCYVHSRILADSLTQARQLHPGSKIIAHPECPMPVIEQADHITSTSGMIDYVRSATANEFIIATEMGMVERLKIEFPDKTFFSAGGVCTQMKKNTLEAVLDSLEKEDNEIEVPEDIRQAAKRALDKMLEI